MAVIPTPAACQEKQSGSEASDRTIQTLQSSNWQLTTSTIHMIVFYSYTFIYIFSHVCGAHCRYASTLFTADALEIDSNSHFYTFLCVLELPKALYKAANTIAKEKQ